MNVHEEDMNRKITITKQKTLQKRTRLLIVVEKIYAK